MDYSEWIDLAIERMCEKDSDSPAFELKDLFTGDEWNRLTRGQKTTLGREFARMVKEGEIEGVSFAPFSKNGRHNKYIVFREERKIE